jgi:molybdate transport system substrate-binding protein
MKKRWMATIAASLIFMLAQTGAAQNAPVRLIASNGVKAVLDEVLPQAEKAIEHPVSAQFGTTADFMKKIEGGQDFDVVVLTAEAIDKLNKDGKTASPTRADLSQVGIGVGIRAGAPKPDIRTAAALTKTLVNAK